MSTVDQQTIKSQNTIIRTLFILALIGTSISSGVIYMLYNKSIKPIIEVRVEERIVEQLPFNTLFHYTKTDLHAAMAESYRFLSTRQIDTLIEAIYATSKRYNMDPLILYAICATESSFRWWLTHDKVKVLNDQNKPIETSAIGLGGVIYEIWGNKLKEQGIIETKTDLYNPVTNIEAIGFIYTQLKAMPLKDGSSHAAQSALIRYFGGNYQAYFKKIDEVIIQLFRTKFYERENTND